MFDQKKSGNMTSSNNNNKKESQKIKLKHQIKISQRKII